MAAVEIGGPSCGYMLRHDWLAVAGRAAGNRSVTNPSTDATLDRTASEYQVTLASDLGQLQWNQLSLLSQVVD